MSAQGLDYWRVALAGRMSRRRLVGGAAATTVAALEVGRSSRPALGKQEPPSGTGSSPVLVRNAALVITVDPALGDGPLGIIADGDVLFAGGTITATGQGLSAPGASVVDARGKIVLPGFVDVHNHLWQSVFRGGCTDEDLLGWLANCNRPVRGALTEADIYPVVRLSTLDVIETGVTTVVDFAGSFSPPVAREYLRALNESGLRYVFGFSQPAQGIENIPRIKEELIDRNPNATLQVTGTAGMPNLEDTRRLTRLARDLGVKFNIHLLENIKQRDEEQFRSLELAGALGPDVLVNHAIHLTDEELASLAAHDVRVSHNPLSNMRLASGIIRLPDLHAAGVKVGIGLDGGTNDTSDMFASVRAAVGLQRAKTLRADVYPTVTDVLRMATMGGAEVLDMAGTIGSLTPGKSADLIILDPSRVNFAPRWDWLSQIVFNAQPTNVEYVFAGGKPLKAAGQLVGVSPADTIQAAERAALRIKESLQA